MKKKKRSAIKPPICDDGISVLWGIPCHGDRELSHPLREECVLSIGHAPVQLLTDCPSTVTHLIVGRAYYSQFNLI